MQKIKTFLWFNDQAEEAARFYTSIFKNSEITSINRQSPGGPAFMVQFTLEGQEYMALNGGPHYAFSPAISLYVNCDTQEEIDYYWEKLSEGGKTNRCGWLDDRFGLTWQIVPTVLGKFMSDPQRAGQVMQAFMKMEKFDIAALKEAYDNAVVTPA
jgi:predicted 3-demethylubiquinone-9 3-methyltransferase (glyoxalase superfamily)